MLKVNFGKHWASMELLKYIEVTDNSHFKLPAETNTGNIPVKESIKAEQNVLYQGS